MLPQHVVNRICKLFVVLCTNLRNSRVPPAESTIVHHLFLLLAKTIQKIWYKSFNLYL